VVVDYPNSKKAKKVFLCLFVGGGGTQQIPQGLQGEAEDDNKVRFERRRDREKSKIKNGVRKHVKGRDWILKKKEARSSSSSPNIQGLTHFIAVVSKTGQRRCTQ